jgi:isocitrate lyase
MLTIENIEKLNDTHLSGWQVAAANNTANTTYPDQSLYPVDSVPKVVKGINNAFRRAINADLHWLQMSKNLLAKE